MMIDLDAAKKLCEAATPGPWLLLRSMLGVETTQVGRDGVIYGGFVWSPDFDEDDTHERRAEYLRQDGVFIATARTLVPELIAEIERLRAALAADAS